MPKRTDKSTLYKDRNNEFRWITVAGNGKKIGASTEGYRKRKDAIANAKRNGVKKILDMTKEK